MAKKKKSSRKSSKKQVKNSAPQHSVPDGFWRQIWAVALITVSVLLVVAWFGTGGPALQWLHEAIIQTVGYTVYVLPVLFTYLAIEIFRGEDNRVPLVVKFAALLEIIWLSGLFGLFESKSGQTTGGFVGDLVNSGMLLLVDSTIAIFLYGLLIVVTVIYIVGTDPITVLKKVWEMVRGDGSEQEANVKVMRTAAAVDENKIKSKEFTLNAGVPILSAKDAGKTSKKSPKLPGAREASSQAGKATEEHTALVTVSDPDWKGPSVDLLEKNQAPADAGDVQQNAQIIQDTLREFNIDVEMEGANIGPKVTQYTLRPPSGVKLTRITALETNIALNLAAQSIRIEAPIPGQRAVGIEVPNRRAADVRLRGVLESKAWRSSREPLSFAIGKDISGEPVVGELNKMPHLLVAGQTNSGKSVMINTLLCSLLYRNSPSQMKLILVDPKQVEMARYKDIPHLLTPIITQPEKTISALKWAVNEMERRYELLAEVGEVNIKDYNNSLGKSQRGKKISVQDEEGAEVNTDQPAEDGAMPYIVIIIDEMADLMMTAGRDVENLIVRLAQKARAVGIHLVLATQSPRADVITGLIKANIPAKIAFTVGNQVESRIILDSVGADKLLGSGDMLYKTATMNKPSRIQGAWVENDEVKKIADHLRMQSAPQYNDEITSQPVQINGKGGMVGDFGGDEDAMFNDAVQVVIDAGKASTTLLQLRLKVGYARAARIMGEMEERGIIGPAHGSKPREVLVSSLDDLGSGDL